jgi:hypothetical protein
MPLQLESYAEPEVAVAAVVVAAVASPPVRRTLRRGLVYGLAGILVVGDKVASAGSAVAGGLKGAGKAIGNPAPVAAPPVAEGNPLPS